MLDSKSNIPTTTGHNYNLGDSGLIFSFTDDELKKHLTADIKHRHKIPSLAGVIKKQTEESVPYLFEVGDITIAQDMVDFDWPLCQTGYAGAILSRANKPKGQKLTIDDYAILKAINNGQVSVANTGEIATSKDWQVAVNKAREAENILKLSTTKTKPLETFGNTKE